MLSRFCITRPIFAMVLSLIIIIAGGVSIFSLPVAQYPDITPIQITVTATYPGADSQTIASTVAAPIETQVNGVDNMLYMQSVSSPTGQMTLNVYFDIGTDPDIAQVQVQNRVSQALAQLPQSVQQNGVDVEKRSSSFLMLIGVYSPDDSFDQSYVGNYANLYVLDTIKRIQGANQAEILGDADLALRIWLQPDRMAELKITAADVQNAVSQQNQQFGAGNIGQAPSAGKMELTYPLVTPGRMKTAKEFEDIILRADSNGTAIVRLGDVAKAEIGLNQYSMRSALNGKTATMIAVYQQSGSNALQVSTNVRAALEDMSKTFPDGIAYAVSLDTTEFVRSSIHEVVMTLLIAIVLVVLVVFVFLQNVRSTLIPVAAVMVAVIGTFGALLALGFSINLLTLFALVLAIGIVVDDAIVVVENVERNMEQFKLNARDATLRAMEEVTGPVIAIVLVLCAVFIPVAFVSGTTGLLYRQFALTIACSVTISGFVALSLSPALASLILKPGRHTRWKGFQWFNQAFDKLTKGYVKVVSVVVRRSLVALTLFAVMLVCIGVLFSRIPTSFVPEEDQGYLLVAVIMPDSSSLDRTEATTEQVAKLFREHPAVHDATAVAGYSFIDSQQETNMGTVFVNLNPSEQRSGEALSAEGVVKALYPKLALIPEARIIPINPPSIPGLGTQGGFEFWVENRGDGDAKELQAAIWKLIGASAKYPELSGLISTFQASTRQMLVKVDNAKAETLGVPMADVYGALQTQFGSSYVSQYVLGSRVWQVILQGAPQYRSAPTDLGYLYVKQKNDQMIPLSALVKTEFTSGPSLVTRFNNFPAAKINGNAAPGYSSGDAIAAMQKLAAEELPAGYSYAWSGEAFQQNKSGNTTVLVFVFGIIMVFLILAAQYESWALPLTVLSAVPFGIFGALVAIWARGIPNDVYFQIGLVTLVGLAAKNAILIVEFVILQRQAGLSPLDAVLKAVELRLRPIIMTSLAFIFGAVPLAIATGAGSNSRHSIGTGIIGGMLAATSLALLFVPLFSFLVERAGERRAKKRGASQLPADVNGTASDSAAEAH
ncbi:multidrug efflux RND transporter permease subunit [Pseudomonas nicosulfuronedens]|uniref:Efflux pump membrane transporter n=1 Tax=Pseudomonas nicosulfuronedens TaxID=2571105 RepID=A0A5R9RPL0_9PSED|nr:multidrug efflux RND transporter permease subunit [Pseudomonas nicosulfuronedens]MDH1009712.1 multidrug efflux RND transporter permease subunit [Pseudomonas nicosulfuronedens]MDH1981011.1 multidrug efflux RND transporter permease subunit [Pseudomonas nicosulfuronedens]MDH2027728.1 multidrug efflux RND transporter permease subunit [Pseudomonas nicosulfuronedens]TLX78635.1 multidrug efflux RND transporter permease subunit [Pseudomonas nicosulfuronedens]